MGQRLGQVMWPGWTVPIPEKINSWDGFYYLRAQWKLCYVIWPKRCELTDKWLWPGTLAYRGLAMYTGPGEPVYETRWHQRAEHLIWQLKDQYHV
jgi:hypothetical protein